jgi:hypothetical protein
MSPETGRSRQKGTGKRRRTAAAPPHEQEQRDDAAQPDDLPQLDAAELLRLRRALVQVARDIIVTLGVDPEDAPMGGPGPAARAAGMRRRGLGRRMRGRPAYWNPPEPMRRMRRPGPRWIPGMDGPAAGARRSAGAVEGEEDQ